MVFSGCSVRTGTGKAVVTATGMDTEVGKIAHLLDSAKAEQTPLQARLARLGSTLGLVAIVGLRHYFRRRLGQAASLRLKSL